MQLLDKVHKQLMKKVNRMESFIVNNHMANISKM